MPAHPRHLRAGWTGGVPGPLALPLQGGGVQVLGFHIPGAEPTAPPPAWPRPGAAPPWTVCATSSAFRAVWAESGCLSQVQLTVASLAVRMHLSMLHAENWSGVLLAHIRPLINLLCRQVQRAGKSHPVLSQGTDTQDLGNKRTDAGCWSYAPPKSLKGERDS